MHTEGYVKVTLKRKHIYACVKRYTCLEVVIILSRNKTAFIIKTKLTIYNPECKQNLISTLRTVIPASCVAGDKPTWYRYAIIINK